MNSKEVERMGRDLAMGSCPFHAVDARDYLALVDHVVIVGQDSLRAGIIRVPTIPPR
jgi:hypothetical protein